MFKIAVSFPEGMEDLKLLSDISPSNILMKIKPIEGTRSVSFVILTFGHTLKI
jgi:hypothetical protein